MPLTPEMVLKNPQGIIRLACGMRLRSGLERRIHCRGEKQLEIDQPGTAGGHRPPDLFFPGHPAAWTSGFAWRGNFGWI